MEKEREALSPIVPEPDTTNEKQKIINPPEIEKPKRKTTKKLYT